LAGLVLPNCKSYHQWHNTRLKGKSLGNKEREKEGIKAKRKNHPTIDPNVDPNSSKLSTYADERIFQYF